MNMRKDTHRSKVVGALWLLLSLSCPAFSLPAAADLMIFPTRVVFDGRTRTAQIDLMNTDDKPATYRIGFTQRRMSPLGNFSNIDTPLANELFADQMIRYSPRQVVLAPGAGQTVRLLLRKPAGLAEGEYRSHLFFERIPDVVPPTRSTQSDRTDESGQNSASGEQAVEIRLSALLNVSIPVIVRHGATHAAVVITPPRLLRDEGEGSPVIAFNVEREGNRSVYGDLSAFYTAPGAAPVLIAQAKGVAVYSPYAVRQMRLGVRADAPKQMTRGQLRVEFRARPEDQRVLLGSAEASL